MKSVLSWLALLALVGLFLYMPPRGCSRSEVIERRDTVVVVRTDTITDTIPKLVTERIVRTEFVPIVSLEAEIDTLAQEINAEAVTLVGDSVAIPITQREYQTNEYHAWVSGWRASLDSIQVYQRTIQETITITKQERRKRWGIGLQVGYGITPQGFKPYFGVGISYNLFTF